MLRKHPDWLLEPTEREGAFAKGMAAVTVENWIIWMGTASPVKIILWMSGARFLII